MRQMLLCIQLVMRMCSLEPVLLLIFQVELRLSERGSLLQDDDIIQAHICKRFRRFKPPVWAARGQDERNSG